MGTGQAVQPNLAGVRHSARLAGRQQQTIEDPLFGLRTTAAGPSDFIKSRQQLHSIVDATQQLNAKCAQKVGPEALKVDIKKTI